MDVRYKRQIPSSFDEMDSRHLIAYTQALALKLSDFEMRKSILFIWLKLPSRVFFNIPFGEALELAATLDFLFEKEIASGKLIIPFIWHRLCKFYGPGDDFKFLSVYEFAMADQFANAYIASQNKDDLHKLIAVLYRKATAQTNKNFILKGEDRREKFYDNKVETIADRFKTVPEYVSTAVFINFISWRQHIVKENDFVFTTDIDKQGLGWPQIIYTMAGDKLGDFNNVCEMPLLNALYILRIVHEINKDSKKTIKQTEEA